MSQDISSSYPFLALNVKNVEKMLSLHFKRGFEVVNIYWYNLFGDQFWDKTLINQIILFLLVEIIVIDSPVHVS